MKTHPCSLFVLTLAGCLAAGNPVLAAASTASTPQDHTSTGSFQTSAGIKGSYEETFTAAGGVAVPGVGSPRIPPLQP